jgi:hypothetical protein
LNTQLHTMPHTHTHTHTGAARQQDGVPGRRAAGAAVPAAGRLLHGARRRAHHGRAAQGH